MARITIFDSKRVAVALAVVSVAVGCGDDGSENSIDGDAAGGVPSTGAGGTPGSAGNVGTGGNAGTGGNGGTAGTPNLGGSPAQGEGGGAGSDPVDGRDLDEVAASICQRERDACDTFSPAWGCEDVVSMHVSHFSGCPDEYVEFLRCADRHSELCGTVAGWVPDGQPCSEEWKALTAPGCTESEATIVASVDNVADDAADEVGCDPCPAIYGNMALFEGDCSEPPSEFNLLSTSRIGPYFGEAAGSTSVELAPVTRTGPLCFIAELFDADTLTDDDPYSKMVVRLSTEGDGNWSGTVVAGSDVTIVPRLVRPGQLWRQMDVTLNTGDLTISLGLAERTY
jgi:hypothetical protein